MKLCQNMVGTILVLKKIKETSYFDLINERVKKSIKEQPNKSSCNNLTRLTAEKSLFCKTHVLEHLAFIDGRLIAKLRKISTHLRKMG